MRFVAGGDCSLLGVPTLENETIDLNLVWMSGSR